MKKIVLAAKIMAMTITVKAMLRWMLRINRNMIYTVTSHNTIEKPIEHAASNCAQRIPGLVSSHR